MGLFIMRVEVVVVRFGANDVLRSSLSFSITLTAAVVRRLVLACAGSWCTMARMVCWRDGAGLTGAAVLEDRGRSL